MRFLKNSFPLIAKYFDGSLGPGPARAPWALGPWALGPSALALEPWALRPSARRGPGPGPWARGPGFKATRVRATRFQGNAGSSNAVSRQRGFELRHLFPNIGIISSNIAIVILKSHKFNLKNVFFAAYFN